MVRFLSVSDAQALAYSSKINDVPGHKNECTAPGDHHLMCPTSTTTSSATRGAACTLRVTSGRPILWTGIGFPSFWLSLAIFLRLVIPPVGKCWTIMEMEIEEQRRRRQRVERRRRRSTRR